MGMTTKPAASVCVGTRILVNPSADQESMVPALRSGAVATVVKVYLGPLKEWVTLYTSLGPVYVDALTPIALAAE